MRLINVVGTRPNFMKIAPIIRALNNYSYIEHILVHTGQHYDEKMSTVFFKELDIQKPDINLNIGPNTQTKQTAEIMIAFEDVCDNYQPDIILVVGDVNSTMACTLVATKKNIKVIHVEAGIRSRDMDMPEEVNRLVTDSISNFLLPPSLDAVENLIKEGHCSKKIKLVGNVMIDTLLHFQPQIKASTILDTLKIKNNEYATLTLHRPSNVDNKKTLENILVAINYIQTKIPVVFSVHPRTINNIEKMGLKHRITSMKNLILTPPLGYYDFGKLISNSSFILTDSGGIQEETTVYKIPCITIRENTERPITIEEGSNELAGTSSEKIIELVNMFLDGNWKKSTIPKYWDGKTAERIVDFIKKLQ